MGDFKGAALLLSSLPCVKDIHYGSRVCANGSGSNVLSIDRRVCPSSMTQTKQPPRFSGRFILFGNRVLWLPHKKIERQE